MIKISSNKFNDLNLKYNEEINKNKLLSLELKELNLKNQRLIEEKRKIPKNEKETLFRPARIGPSVRVRVRAPAGQTLHARLLGRVRLLP